MKMTVKSMGIAVLAVMLVFAFLGGCKELDEPQPQPQPQPQSQPQQPSDISVTLQSVTANGSENQTTTQLTLTFSSAITELTASDITLSGVLNVNKGVLSGSNPYTLPISGFTSGGTLSVVVAKLGYAISGSPKTVAIYKMYNIVIDLRDNVSGDTVTASPTTGKEGDTVTLSYNVANTAHYNLLEFGGVSAEIAQVNSAGNGTRTYTITPADSSNGVITITSIFTHTDLTPDHIAFTNTEGHIIKIYGDAAFTNAVTTAHYGSGAITYSSDNTSVATVNSSGQVTILKAGSTTITAQKMADTVYAAAEMVYTLTINRKPVTITGLSVSNKEYDGTTTATVTGTAVINGLVGGDNVTVSAGTALFADKYLGTGKIVTFNSWSLSGVDEGNYTLSAQPASVTADIIITIEMVQIPTVTFTMGSPLDEPNRVNDETQHSVTLSAFKIGKYEVTQAQYEAVMEKTIQELQRSYESLTQDYGRGVNYPVYFVSWYDAIVFCNKLSIMEGSTPAYKIPKYGTYGTDPRYWGSVPTSFDAAWNAVEIVPGSTGYRLPTEAQWEYACRAGTTTVYNTGDTISDNTGWYEINSGNKTHEVGLKPPNARGLYDMHGNVSEWCWDWYGDYSSNAQTDPMNGGGSSQELYRVMRGGNWSCAAEYVRSAYRGVHYHILPYGRYNGVGFRLVRP